MLTQIKIPHAFQDILGSDKTPTLPLTVIAFYTLIQRWKELIDDKIDWHHIIQPGLDKLLHYEIELMKTPAYVLAMGKYISKISSTSAKIPYIPAINPRDKLSHYSATSETKFKWAKEMFLKAVS